MNSNDQLLDSLAHAFDNPQAPTETLRELSDHFLDLLEDGTLRCAHVHDNAWHVDERVKKGILLAFRIGQKAELSIGAMSFVDKSNLWPRTFSAQDPVRVVPFGSTVRRGAYIGKNVIIMPPSYVNIGSFVDDDTLIDSNALVGSCAQVGKRVHVSAAVQLGGVLEPIGALPVIIEDDCLIGGNSGIYEGTRVSHGAVIGSGVVLTKSVKVYDLVNERIITAEGPDGVLTIPSNAVVVPGSRSLKSPFAEEHGLSVSAPMIIKYRDSKTDTKIKLEGVLR